MFVNKKVSIRSYALFIIFLISVYCYSQEPEETEDWSVKPEVVIPAKKFSPPSDAIVLFDGSDFSKWSGRDGGVQWKIKGKAMEVGKGTGNIQTVQPFRDVQIHIEWRTPKKIESEGQGRGNSGVYLMGLYEIQVLDSWENETYYNGQAGSIYKQYSPLVNACRRPGKWQTYDIIFQAPEFNEDKTLKDPGYITVIHNGLLIQNHVELKGPTVYQGYPEYLYHESKLPLLLQDHGNPVEYRNIWIREL